MCTWSQAFATKRKGAQKTRPPSRKANDDDQKAREARKKNEVKNANTSFVLRFRNFIWFPSFLYVGPVCCAACCGFDRDAPKKWKNNRCSPTCRVSEAGPCANRLPHKTVSESTQLHFAGKFQRKAQMGLHFEHLLYFPLLSHNPVSVSRIDGIVLKLDAQSKEDVFRPYSHIDTMIFQFYL